jgi:hypothetical protein
MPRARPTGPNMATDRKLGSGELAPMGGLGGIVEIDETFIGNDRSIKPHGEKRGRGYAHKFKVLALVDRAAGTARTMVVDDLKAATLTPILTDNIAREARVMTDKAGYYSRLARASPSTSSFAMAPRNGRAARSTPTPSKASSPSSSAAWQASTSTARKSICTATRPSSSSATTTAPATAAMTPGGPHGHWRASRARG